MSSWSRDCDPDIKVTLLGGTRNGEDGASYVPIYTYEGAIRLNFQYTYYLGTHYPRPRAGRTSLRRISLAMHRRAVERPIGNGVTPIYLVVTKPGADLQATGLFIEAERQNDSARRLEPFLEQSFDRCTGFQSIGLARHDSKPGGKAGSDAYSIPTNPLLSSELPLPQMNLPVNILIIDLKCDRATNPGITIVVSRVRGICPLVDGFRLYRDHICASKGAVMTVRECN